MIPRLMLVVAMLAMAWSPSLAAGTATTTAKRPAAHGTKHATGARATKTRSAKSATSAKAAKPATPDSTRLAGGPRKLEDIHIEGEIPAPQVLFVTARDQRRFTRFHHQRYLKSSAQVGETTQLPTRVALTPHTPEAP